MQIAFVQRSLYKAWVVREYLTRPTIAYDLVVVITTVV